MEDYKMAIDELLKGVKMIVEEAKSNTTKIYDGIIVAEDGGKWLIQFNGEKHALSVYGEKKPVKGQLVKVFLPNNNISSGFFM